MNVTLFGCNGVLIKSGRFGDTETRGEDGQVKMEAEMGGVRLVLL